MLPPLLFVGWALAFSALGALIAYSVIRAGER